MEGERVKKLKDELEELRDRHKYACSSIKDFSKRVKYLEEKQRIRIRVWGEYTTMIYLIVIMILWLVLTSLILGHKKITCK